MQPITLALIFDMQTIKDSSNYHTNTAATRKPHPRLAHRSYSATEMPQCRLCKRPFKV